VRGGEHVGTDADRATTTDVKLKRKEYEAEPRKLHAELVAMQEWVKYSGVKICVAFEGRASAGKGGTIKAITGRVSPRVFRIVALPSPTDRERSQIYLQRYIPHLPAAGEVVIFDRSWYNRAGVERIMGFCTEEQSQRFLELTPAVERTMVESGIILLKYWLEVGEAEQTKRLRARVDDPRKIWKLSDMDLKSYSRWYDYARTRDEMFAATDTAWARWYVVRTDDKRRGRLNLITPPPQPGALRTPGAEAHHVPCPPGSRRLRRTGSDPPTDPDPVRHVRAVHRPLRSRRDGPLGPC
jgi:polyphosphate kinase